MPSHADHRQLLHALGVFAVFLVPYHKCPYMPTGHTHSIVYGLQVSKTAAKANKGHMDFQKLKQLMMISMVTSRLVTLTGHTG